MPPIPGRHVVKLSDDTIETLRAVYEQLQQEDAERGSELGQRAEAARELMEDWPLEEGQSTYAEALARLTRTLERVLGYHEGGSRWTKPQGFASKEEASRELSFLIRDEDAMDRELRLRRGDTGPVEEECVVIDPDTRVSPWGIVRQLADDAGQPHDSRLEWANNEILDVALTLADEVEAEHEAPPGLGRAGAEGGDASGSGGGGKKGGGGRGPEKKG